MIVRSRIVMLCDWLPPDFGAVGQYAIQFAEQAAAAGAEVTLIGFSSRESSVEYHVCEEGSVTIRRIRRSQYDRTNFFQRATWTVLANTRLAVSAARWLRRGDEVRFTGSPPYLLHFVMPVAKLIGARTRYRITDFHPECLISALGSAPWWLQLVQKVTNFWRRRVDTIEVLGEDQRRHLTSARVDIQHIELRRDHSPARFDPGVLPLEAPAALRGRKLILYSGNWGVAHDHMTFLQGFELFCRSHAEVAGLWLNAVGNRADLVESELRARDLPFVRTKPAALELLPRLLLAADLHLITLEDRFVGLVLPSKVYACVASGRPVLFVGSETSDVDLVCRTSGRVTQYRRVDVGDSEGVAAALEELLL